VIEVSPHAVRLEIAGAGFGCRRPDVILGFSRSTLSNPDLNTESAKVFNFAQTSGDQRAYPAG
jgi:hypothetical protein